MIVNQSTNIGWNDNEITLFRHILVIYRIYYLLINMYVLINIVSNQNIYVLRRIISQNCAAIINPPPYIIWGIIYKACIEINYLAI